MYDALVVGAGPAGAAAAFLLSKSGFRTLIVDKRSLPRKKICGGLITMHCAAEIRRIFGSEIPAGVHVDPPILTVRVVPPSGRKNGFYLSNYHIHNVDRGRFDYWLTSMAIREGATLVTSHLLTDFEDNGEGIVAHFDTEGGSTTFEGRYLVGADGVYSACRQKLLGRGKQSTMSILQEYYRDRGIFENSFYLYFRSDISPMYAYVEPKDGCTIIGLGVHRSLGPSAEVGLSRFKELLRRDYGFDGLGYLCREGWSIPFGEVAYGKGRAILIGDAGGFCEPLTGEGIYYGIESAKAAAVAISSVGHNGGVLAEAYAETAYPLGKKMEDITARVRSLTDEEREDGLQAKKERLSRELKIKTLA